jgi:hypothetical protein
VLFRLATALALSGMTATVLVPPAAMAQPAPTDPPARVGRLARLAGTVSFHTADQPQWVPATLNYPVTSGDSFWTQPQSAAGIEIGATHLALDQQTEFDIDGLDTLQLTATEPQGAVYLRLGLVNPGESTVIRTPRGDVRITAAGRYEVAAGDTEQPTLVTVVEGAAQVTGDGGLALSIGPHQTATVTGAGPFQGSVGPEVDDPFLTAQLRAEQPSAAVAYQPPPVVAQMTGVADLESVGTWSEAPQYGHVWYPPVDPGWVPYRHGHWAYVAPWGWTWVDDASWGFAPYHYGRWVDVGNRWGWVPVAPGAPVGIAPVYAPALVDFVGIAAGVAVGAAIGVGVGLALGGGNVGWVPLGFHEPYLPPYRYSPGYINRINSPNFSSNQNIGQVIDQRRSFVNNGTINRNTTVINNYYANAAGATIAPAAVMQTGRPVATAARAVTPQQFAQVAQPRLQPPVRPTAATPGLTPAVARQLNIPTARLVRPAVAPGPALAPRPAGHAVAPVALRPPAPGARPVAAPGVAPAVAGHPAPAAHPEPAAHPAERPVDPGVAPGVAPAVAPRPPLAPATPRVEPPAPVAHAPAAVAPHAETPRPALAAPHAEAPHPAAAAPHPEAPRPAAVAPHPEAPRPAVAAPHAEAPRPAAVAPHPEAPRPAAPVPHPAPRPAPRPEPRPAPRPEARPAPHPEARPAAHPAPRKDCPPGHPC